MTVMNLQADILSVLNVRHMIHLQVKIIGQRYTNLNAINVLQIVPNVNTTQLSNILPVIEIFASMDIDGLKKLVIIKKDNVYNVPQ